MFSPGPSRTLLGTDTTHIPNPRFIRLFPERRANFEGPGIGCHVLVPGPWLVWGGSELPRSGDCRNRDDAGGAANSDQQPRRRPPPQGRPSRR